MEVRKEMVDGYKAITKKFALSDVPAGPKGDQAAEGGLVPRSWGPLERRTMRSF